MITLFEQFNELDPYGEEDWDGIEELTPNTPINIGDIIYWDDDVELCTVKKIEDKEDGDDWIWATISQESIDKGFAKESLKDSPFGRRSLTNSRLKIKHA